MDARRDRDGQGRGKLHEINDVGWPYFIPCIVSIPTDLERLLTDHAEHIEAVVRRYADDAMERDDLRQEIAIAVWLALPNFAGRASERTYILRIAHNRASTFCLRRARTRALFSSITGDVATNVTVTGEHDRLDLSGVLQGALSRLPESQRDVLALSVAGHSPYEIARATGRNAGAVRVALHRARATLRAWLGAPRKDS